MGTPTADIDRQKICRLASGLAGLSVQGQGLMSAIPAEELAGKLDRSSQLAGTNGNDSLPSWFFMDPSQRSMSLNFGSSAVTPLNCLVASRTAPDLIHALRIEPTNALAMAKLAAF